MFTPSREAETLHLTLFREPTLDLNKLVRILGFSHKMTKLLFSSIMMRQDGQERAQSLSTQLRSELLEVLIYCKGQQFESDLSSQCRGQILLQWQSAHHKLLSPDPKSENCQVRRKQSKQKLRLLTKQDSSLPRAGGRCVIPTVHSLCRIVFCVNGKSRRTLSIL